MSQNTNDTGSYIALFCILAGVFFMLLALFAGGYRFGRHCEQKKAIEAGVGRWTVDPATGDTDFRYGVGGARP